MSSNIVYEYGGKHSVGYLCPTDGFYSGMHSFG